MDKFWKNKFKNNICSIEELKKHLKLTKKEVKDLKKVINIHPMGVS